MDAPEAALLLDAKDRDVLASYVRKCDRRLLAYLCIGYAADSLSKMALPNAKVAGLADDLGLEGADVNWALGVYYLGAFAFQLPSNLVLKKMRPSRWLAGSMLCWALATAGTALVGSARQLALCRFLFGAAQAGYLTGSLYYISFWYPRALVRRCTGFLFASAALGGIVAGPLCAALTAAEPLGLRAWQRIFLATGLLSGAWGVVGLRVLGDYPDTAEFLEADERRLARRIMAHQHTVASAQRVSARQVRMALGDAKIWMWTVIDFCANAATQVNGMFGPSIVASHGFSAPAAQALTALTNLMAFGGMASIAFVARAAGGSSTAIVLSNLLTISGFLLALLASSGPARLLALFIFSFASPQPAAHGPAWEMANQRGGTKPAMAAALTAAFGGLGPLATALVFRDQDRPEYTLGHSVCLALTALCLVVAAALRLVLAHENRRRDAARPAVDLSALTEEQVDDLADNHPDFRYVL